jgi:hypothetical protein
LRLNIITGDVLSLPFRYKVRLNNKSEYILNKFITTIKSILQHGDDIEFFNKQDWNEYEDAIEEEYILDLFVKQLPVIF